jgi:hypothetical protein
LNDLPDAPVTSPTHQWLPSRFPLGNRYVASSSTRSRNNFLTRSVSLTTHSFAVEGGSLRSVLDKRLSVAAGQFAAIHYKV